MQSDMATLARCSLFLVLAAPVPLKAEPVAVRFPEGPVQAALVLRSLDGKMLANGELTQTVRSGQVSSQVVFRFTDGSVHDETAVFSQNGALQLTSYRIVQTGPTFRRALDMTLDTRTGRVLVRHREKGDDEAVEDETLPIPSDVANGMIPTVLKNLSGTTGAATVSFVAATPAVRQVKLAISRVGSEPVAGSNQQAAHYVVKAVIGGVAGLVAPLVGKQPPDTHVWILEGTAPSFVRSQAALFYGGPVWRIELAGSPPSPAK
jgi:hypothetical protein